MSVWTRIEALLLDDQPKPTRVLFGPNRGSRLMLKRATETKMWAGTSSSAERGVRAVLASTA